MELFIITVVFKGILSRDLKRLQWIPSDVYEEFSLARAYF
jgi:hypothetical protein